MYRNFPHQAPKTPKKKTKCLDEVIFRGKTTHRRDVIHSLVIEPKKGDKYLLDKYAHQMFKPPAIKGTPPKTNQTSILG